MMLPSRLGCPLSLKTPNMGNPGLFDAALARSFEGLTRLLDISRQKPLPRARVTYTSDGTPIRVLPGNRLEFGHTTKEEITEEKRKIVRITAASKDELRKSVQSIKDRKN